VTQPVQPVTTPVVVDGLLLLAGGVRTFFTLGGGTRDFGNGAGPVPIPDIVALLASYGMPAPLVGTTGWKQRQRILNQGVGQANRVLFMPGDDKGAEGDLVQPRRTNGNPRALWKWERIVTASIWAVDSTDTANEELQIQASSNLFQLTTQAIQWFASADYVMRRVRRDPLVSENLPFGREILVELIHREPLFDIPQKVVTGFSPNVQRNPAS
jgi:hypothetical protein